MMVEGYLHLPKHIAINTTPPSSLNSLCALQCSWGSAMDYHPMYVCMYVCMYLAVLALSCGMWDLVPWPGIEPRPLAVGVRSLSHWTTREDPIIPFWNIPYTGLLRSISPSLPEGTHACFPSIPFNLQNGSCVIDLTPHPNTKAGSNSQEYPEHLLFSDTRPDARNTVIFFFF